MDIVASSIEEYLPVYIPVFLTVISVLAGVVTKRIELTLESLLKIHSDLVLGLFSFVIWALVAFQQTGRIDLNDQSSISLIRVVLLLFANIVLLIAGLILLNVKWDHWFPVVSDSVAETRQAGRRRRWENMFNGGFLLVTFFGVFAPIWLAKPRAIMDASVSAPQAPRHYMVAVPYKDTSVERQLGAAKWDGRTLCEVYPVSAADEIAALSQARALLNSSGRLTALFPTKGQVSILEDRIAVGARQ